MTDEFNFEKFYESLYAASESAFTSIQHAHENESFYIFALYTSGDLAYILPTSSTEEGLTLAAQKYTTLEHYRNFTIEQLREKLRWSPADSSLHMEGEEYFVDVNKLIENVPLILDAIPTEVSWTEFHDFYNKFLEVCIKVLKRLDNEGVFGEWKKRKAVVLNILMGDQSDSERMKFAKLLNPSSVYDHFKQIYHA